MTRITPLSIEELPEAARAGLEYAKATMGFVPNSVMTMGRWPELLMAFRDIVSVIYGESEIPNSLKRMIGAVTSAAAGCEYCKAHTTHGAHGQGVDDKKIAEIWSYQTSDKFDDPERAAFDLAFAAAQIPNATTDEHFTELRKYYNERQMVEIMAVIGMFGFLNRWNDSLATELEAEPVEFAKAVLPSDQWISGKHQPT